MNNFWVGTISGMICALILFMVSMFIMNDKINELQKIQTTLLEQHRALQKQYDDNVKIMQTYKFFNDSWQAIIDMRKEENNDSTDN